MKRMQSILLLRPYGESLHERDLVSQQRFRLFKMAMVFALFIFTVIVWQATLANVRHLLVIGFVCLMFVILFLNYFALAIHRKPGVTYGTLLFLAFAILHVVSYVSGGIQNSGMFFIAPLVLSAFMLLGKKGGILMAALSAIHVIYFYFVSIYTHWVNYSLIGAEPGQIKLDFLISGTLSIIILSAQANYVEKSKNAITEDIKLKRDELATRNAELLNTQKDLRIKNKEFEQKNKELEQFAYVASHDLQEPLRTISGFVELLRQQYQGKLDDKGDKYVTYIAQSSDRMKIFVNDLLQYSRIEGEKKNELVNCTTILGEVLADLGKVIEETEAVITAGPLPVIYGHPGEIKQLFQNLIANGIKFRKKDRIPEIKISAVRKKDLWQFAFIDNGIGIEEQHKERIFVIFQRLHTRSEYQGSGIGLSNCKKIIELHNGRIWVDSNIGEGSTFQFTIPQNNN